MPESKELNYSLWVPREECKEEARFISLLVRLFSPCIRVVGLRSILTHHKVVLGRKSFQGIECVGACGGLNFLCKG